MIIAQLQTYQDSTVHLNWQSRQEEHYSEKKSKEILEDLWIFISQVSKSVNRKTNICAPHTSGVHERVGKWKPQTLESQFELVTSHLGATGNI